MQRKTPVLAGLVQGLLNGLGQYTQGRNQQRLLERDAQERAEAKARQEQQDAERAEDREQRQADTEADFVLKMADRDPTNAKSYLERAYEIRARRAKVTGNDLPARHESYQAGQKAAQELPTLDARALLRRRAGELIPAPSLGPRSPLGYEINQPREYATPFSGITPGKTPEELAQDRALALLTERERLDAVQKEKDAQARQGEIKLRGQLALAQRLITTQGSTANAVTSARVQRSNALTAQGMGSREAFAQAIAEYPGNGAMSLEEALQEAGVGQSGTPPRTVSEPAAPAGSALRPLAGGSPLEAIGSLVSGRPEFNEPPPGASLVDAWAGLAGTPQPTRPGLLVPGATPGLATTASLERAQLPAGFSGPPQPAADLPLAQFLTRLQAQKEAAALMPDDSPYGVPLPKVAAEIAAKEAQTGLSRARATDLQTKPERDRYRDLLAFVKTANYTALPPAQQVAMFQEINALGKQIGANQLPVLHPGVTPAVKAQLEQRKLDYQRQVARDAESKRHSRVMEGLTRARDAKGQAADPQARIAATTLMSSYAAERRQLQQQIKDIAKLPITQRAAAEAEVPELNRRIGELGDNINALRVELHGAAGTAPTSAKPNPGGGTAVKRPANWNRPLENRFQKALGDFEAQYGKPSAAKRQLIVDAVGRGEL